MKRLWFFIVFFNSCALAVSAEFKDLKTINSNISMEIDQSRVLKLENTPVTIYNSNDSVVSYLMKDDKTIYIKAKNIGSTDLILINNNSKNNLKLHVQVNYKTSAIKKILRKTFKNNHLKISTLNNKLVLSGTHNSLHDKKKAVEIIQKLLGKVEIIDMSVVNKKHASPQINLRIRVVEMDRSVKRALGLNFGLNFKTNNSNISFNSPTFVPPDGGISKILIGSESSPGLLFGNFSLWSLLNIMSDEKLITSLAEPNIILVPHEKASFLFGGEVPINNAAGLGGTSSVDYRDYGIKIEAVAEILDNDFIRIKLSPSISKLSEVNSLVVTDNNGSHKIPGFITRKIDSTIELRSGQSIALAGLIESESVQNEAHIPGLDKVPLVADLTRQEDVSRQEIEVVFIVTPYLVKPSGNQDLESPVQNVNGLPEGRVALGKPGFIIG